MTDSAGQTGGRGRPLHPPFTHFPVASYVMAAGFDVISVIGHKHQWSDQLWHAGTFVLIAGLVLCLATMLTGFADLVRFVGQRPAALRVVATHVCVMAAVFMVGVGDLALRLGDYHRSSTPPAVLFLTIAAALGVCTGAFFGGTLVYRHGVGVAAVPASEPTEAMAVGQPHPQLRLQAARSAPVRHRARRG
jgi:uncharacterized membrane protein